MVVMFSIFCSGGSSPPPPPPPASSSKVLILKGVFVRRELLKTQKRYQHGTALQIGAQDSQLLKAATSALPDRKASKVALSNSFQLKMLAARVETGYNVYGDPGVVRVMRLKQKMRRTRLSDDEFAKSLAMEQKASLVMTAAAFASIVATTGPDYRRAWELPISQERLSSGTVSFIDDPLPNIQWAPSEKALLMVNLAIRKHALMLGIGSSNPKVDTSTDESFASLLFEGSLSQGATRDPGESSSTTSFGHYEYIPVHIANRRALVRVYKPSYVDHITNVWTKLEPSASIATEARPEDLIQAWVYSLLNEDKPGVLWLTVESASGSVVGKCHETHSQLEEKVMRLGDASPLNSLLVFGKITDTLNEIANAMATAAPDRKSQALLLAHGPDQMDIHILEPQNSGGYDLHRSISDRGKLDLDREVGWRALWEPVSRYSPHIPGTFPPLQKPATESAGQ